MRNPVAFLLLMVALAGPAAAQTASPAPVTSAVPAAFDVAGLHLVLNDEARRLVQQKADGLRRHQPSFQARVDLADASFPIIDRILQEEGVPLDFRYLALQESALLGDARSIHEAVGYWQLKQETATGLGLAVNAAVDERQHLAASTRAAARYLQRNNAVLHNWLNALLSYYTGPAGVKPYTLPTDADATQMAISETTSPYVLMFLAHKLAFEPYCGQNPRPALRLQEFPAVAGQTLYDQALTLHVDSAALATHNHWLLAPAVPADKPYTLIVPIGDITQAAGMVANQRLQSQGELLNLPAVAANSAEVRINNLRALVALPGETTQDLARRANQRLGEFLKHNEITGFDAAIPGRPYFLETKRDVGAVEYHVLQPGERIFDVAQKYGMRQKAIYAKNRLARTDELRPGRLLWLQHTRPREVAPEYRPLTESASLERPSAAASNIDELVEQANEAVALPPSTATESGRTKIKVKVKNADGSETKRVITTAAGETAAPARPAATDPADGWGEVLATAQATAATPAAPAPRRAPAPPVAHAVPTAPTTPAAEETEAPETPEPVVAPAAAVTVAPANRPVVAAERPQLPPPAPAPAPAPLADEQLATEANKLSEATTTAPAPAPRPVPTPRVAPATVVPTEMPLLRPVAPVTAVAPAPKPVEVPKPRPVVEAPAARPVAAPAPRPTAEASANAPMIVYRPAASANATKPAVAPAPLPALPAPAEASHRVEPGETVFAVSRRFGVPPATLIAINQLEAPYKLAAGQVLLLKPAGEVGAAFKPRPAPRPAPTPTRDPASLTPPTHTVEPGETLYSISVLYHTKVAELQALNGRAATDTGVKIGEVLQLPAGSK
ncbi:LysM peptidoglycan-binding domain-containing protein [Hymenobacter sp. DH14]|uniref:LysM peptidoglycan-binding domain-containing protein n=1 Tax=Hymenobacter cyanobacteriorum TaxID=2926463 RepID=A0A9X1VDL8_9BACT|nr:LysM peptidoglycan-binding domain-containing protein [Hymenobacter cyanobacteriorum]MCI1186600.1 LysM peptidoglycan-binding domain-containing protein [Hymenobacter cyanobacteriorum]